MINSITRINNFNFTYAFIFPALAMAPVLWISDRLLSVLALGLFSAYAVSLVFLKRSADLHLSAIAFCILSVVYSIAFEFVIVPEGVSSARIANISFGILAISEIMILKAVRKKAI